MVKDRYGTCADCLTGDGCPNGEAKAPQVGQSDIPVRSEESLKEIDFTDWESEAPFLGIKHGRQYYYM